MSDMGVMVNRLIGNDIRQVYPVTRIKNVISLEETLNLIKDTVSNKSDLHHTHEIEDISGLSTLKISEDGKLTTDYSEYSWDSSKLNGKPYEKYVTSGVYHSSQDLNNASFDKAYIAISNDTSIIPNEIDGTYNYWHIINFPYKNGYCAQLGIPFGTNKIFMRTASNNNWNGWENITEKPMNITIDESLNSLSENPIQNKAVTNALSQKSPLNHSHNFIQRLGISDSNYSIKSIIEILGKVDEYGIKISYESSEDIDNSIRLDTSGINMYSNSRISISPNVLINKEISYTLGYRINLTGDSIGIWKQDADMTNGIKITDSSIIGDSSLHDGNDYPTCNDGDESWYPSIKGFYNIMGYNIEGINVKAEYLEGNGSKITGLKKSQITDFPSSLPANGGTAHNLLNDGYETNQYGNFIHRNANENDHWGVYSNTVSPAFKVYYQNGNAQFKGTVSASSFSGNATSASKLQIGRTLTLGNSGKEFDGSSNISWTLGEIGAAPSLVDPTTDYNTVTTPGLYQMKSSSSNGPLVTGTDSKGSVSYAGLIVLKSDSSSSYFEQIAFKENTHNLFLRPGTSQWRKMEVQGVAGYRGYDKIIAATSNSENDKWKATNIISNPQSELNALFSTTTSERILVLKGTYNISVSSATVLTIKNKIIDFEPGTILNFTTTKNIGAVTLMDIQSSNINANNNYYFSPLKITVTDSYTQSVVLGIKADKSYVNNIEFSGNFRSTFKSFYLNESELNRFSTVDTYSCGNVTGVYSEMGYSIIKNSCRTGTEEGIKFISGGNTIMECNGYSININSTRQNLIINNRASIMGSDSYGIITNNTSYFINIG